MQGRLQHSCGAPPDQMLCSIFSLLKRRRSSSWSAVLWQQHAIQVHDAASSRCTSSLMNFSCLHRPITSAAAPQQGDWGPAGDKGPSQFTGKRRPSSGDGGGRSRSWASGSQQRAREGNSRRRRDAASSEGRGRGTGPDRAAGFRNRNGRSKEEMGSRRTVGEDYVHPPSLMLEAAKRKELPIMLLKRGKARLFWEGQPIVFNGAVETIHGQPQTGDVVALGDASMQAVGWGIYNSHSLFCLRMMQMAHEVDASSESAFELEELLERRIAAAAALRKALRIQDGNTNVYRLINSEGDRLSGLIVDIFSDVAVVASSAAWVELHREAIEKLTLATLGHASEKEMRVIWRTNLEMLQLEGMALVKQQANATEQGEDVGSEAAATAADTEVVENDIQYKVALRSGQKTGFYADQRDSRNLIRGLADGKRVLDLCCYSGGFALSAAKGGASEVTGVDSSLPAISLANENLCLNGFQQPISFVRTDVDDFMREALDADRQWDIVVLDPPKLAPSRKALPRATTRYRKLNAAAMRLVAPGGLLMTCSCSGAVAQGEGLLPIVQEAAMIVGRKVTLLRKAGAAPDHPLDPSYPEGSYLTNLLLRVS